MDCRKVENKGGLKPHTTAADRVVAGEYFISDQPGHPNSIKGNPTASQLISKMYNENNPILSNYFKELTSKDICDTIEDVTNTLDKVCG